MDEQRATHVLRNSLIDKEFLYDTENSPELLEQLTCVPLASVQAASFINENSMTIASYVKLLVGQEQSAIDLLSQDFEVDAKAFETLSWPHGSHNLSEFDDKILPLPTISLCFLACIQREGYSDIVPSAGVQCRTEKGDRCSQLLLLCTCHAWRFLPWYASLSSSCKKLAAISRHPPKVNWMVYVG